MDSKEKVKKANIAKIRNAHTLETSKAMDILCPSLTGYTFADFLKKAKDLEILSGETKAQLKTKILSSNDCEAFGLPRLEWIERQIEYFKALPDEDKQILREYSYKGDTILNTFIRTDYTVDYDLEELSNTSNYFAYRERLDDVLIKFHERINDIIIRAPPITDTMVVYRGAGTDDYIKGNTFESSSVLSTTPLLEIAHGFSSGPGAIIMKMVLPPGTPALINFSTRFPNEYEIMLADGCRFSIEGKYPLKYLTLLNMHLLNPDLDMDKIYPEEIPTYLLNLDKCKPKPAKRHEPYKKKAKVTASGPVLPKTAKTDTSDDKVRIPFNEWFPWKEKPIPLDQLIDQLESGLYDPNYTDDNNLTLDKLIYLAKRDKKFMDYIHAFLVLGANPDPQTRFIPPLVMAIPDIEIFKLLLQYMADPIRNKTFLYILSEYTITPQARIQFLKVLLDAGYFPNIHEGDFVNDLNKIFRDDPEVKEAFQPLISRLGLKHLLKGTNV